MEQFLSHKERAQTAFSLKRLPLTSSYATYASLGALIGSGRPAEASRSGSLLPPAVLSVGRTADPPDRVCRTLRYL